MTESHEDAPPPPKPAAKPPAAADHPKFHVEPAPEPDEQPSHESGTKTNGSATDGAHLHPNGAQQANGGMKKQHSSGISLSRLTDKFKKSDSSNGLKHSGSKANDLSSLYHEHTWDLKRLIAEHPDSRIDAEHPERSQGLSTEKAKELLEKNGPNKLPEAKHVSDFKLFFMQFCNLLWLLMIAAATLSLVGYILDPSDPTTLYVCIILYVMIVVMCTLSWWQEREARKVIRGFENLLPINTGVIRDGNETTVTADQLVVGDIIKIKSGTRVPADARVLVCSELKLETSAITGEAEPVETHAQAVKEDVIIFDAHNVAFNGSMCVDGDGIGLVIKTATDTIIGQIAVMTTQQSDKKSRLEYQIKVFVKFLTVLAFAIGVIAFVVGGLNQHWNKIVKLLVTSFTVCALAMIPEGLPATVTSILTLVARRLASKNVYIKRLDIVEALGSANIIASDKTGTLTKNDMTVTDVWYSNEFVTDIPEHKIIGSQRTMTVKTISKVEHPMSDLLIAMTICNTASFDDSKMPESERNAVVSLRSDKRSVRINMPSISENKSTNHTVSSMSGQNASSNNNTISQSTIQRRRRRRIEMVQGMRAHGAPSEVAMIKYAEQLINVHDFRRRYNVVFEIPFNSKRKYHLVIASMHSVGNGKHRYQVIIKGAPEIIIQRCKRTLTSDGEAELDEKKMEEFQHAYKTFGEHGRRVIGFAHLMFDAEPDKKFNADEQNFPFEALIFVGVCAIMDPPRDETAEAIRECTEAGIKVFMVTGDHHITATAIAKDIGLIGGKNAKGEEDSEVVKGEEISRLTEADWDRLVSRRNLVFARTTPEQKYRIVEECEKRGQIIAMTGDGVNDAPALKKSDIGVGMGSGSDVAKQAADIVLVDDNFSSMVKAVEEGRLMFDNIKKLMIYVLTHAFPELWALFIYYLFGMPIGITTLMILSIDLGTEILPGIALCKEPLEGDVMQRPPRKSGTMLIGKAMIAYCYGYTAHVQSLACFLAYMSVYWDNGIGIGDLWMVNTQWENEKAVLTYSGHDFSFHDRELISREAMSAWQVGIVFGQIFHIFSARTLRQSIFTHGLFSNRLMLVAVAAELVLLLIFVYVPPVAHFLGGHRVGWKPWAIVAVFGLFILAYNEVRKYAVRRWPQNPVVRIFKF
ncbi:Cation-ATPase-N domain-containing protein [Aphelenchoides fujianensis]|nr:Cation-ATPase-N domain-containing protein [Aphelenchoides fujianensis]